LQLYRTDPEAENAQVRGLEALRRERDSRSVSAALARLRDAALGEENLLPPILRAVKAYATVGEICGVLREVFGEYKAPTGL
jgi:methylmalonyl-CoA mutase N-terminal domain/subunit